MNKGVLIVGGSPAGLQAALDLADSGAEVHLAENAPFMGDGQVTAMPPHLLRVRMLEVLKHPHVTLWTQTCLDRADGSGDSFHVRLRQQPRYVDVNQCTGCGDCLEVCPVTVPGTRHQAIYRRDGGQPECPVIDKLGKAPCTRACPAGIHVQGYVALIAQERFQEALDLVREAIPFPGICGRICTHPCELNCRRNEVDAAVAMRSLKRYLADWGRQNAGSARNQNPPKPWSAEDAKRVAVVGAGPTGLTAAYYLARQGYRLTVFDKLPVAGGMMAVGIPAFRLPRDILKGEIEVIEEMGVEIQTGVAWGQDITLEGLRSNGYQAVLLATGLHGSRRLGVAGEDLPGVLDGVGFLRDVALGREVSLGAKMIVVGGGNVAIDVALSARRLGGREVTMVCLETLEEMPAWDYGIAEALEAGIAIVNCWGPHRFLEKHGKFFGLEFKRCTCVFDEQCRFNPQYDENDLQTLEADTVVIAIGQRGELDAVADEKIPVLLQGRIAVDPATFQTSIPWVFAGGDAVYGPKSVVEAIACGKQAAASIDRYLSGGYRGNGRHKRPETAETNNGLPGAQFAPGAAADREGPVWRRPLTAEELLPKPRVPMPRLAAAKRLRSFSEVERGYSEEQAVAEARRCLVCGPCSECMACVDACRPQAIIHEQHETITDLDVGAVIYADDPGRGEQSAVMPGRGGYRVAPEDVLQSSAIAAQVLTRLAAIRPLRIPPQAPRILDDPARIGVLICQCGAAIARTVDTAEVGRHAATLPGVVVAQVLPLACTGEVAQTMGDMVAALDLNRLVLAACTCCFLDQACYSCTYQRIRCKHNLGVFDSQRATPRPLHFAASVNLPRIGWEFVNIREQCAWAHAGSSQAATRKARDLIAAAVAKSRLSSTRVPDLRFPEHSALILGGGQAARTCGDLLRSQNIAVRQVGARPSGIRRVDGRYAVMQNGQTWTAAAVVLAPQEPVELDYWVSVLGTKPHRTHPRWVWGGIETRRPGVFYCDPTLDGAMVGAAAAARVSAWLGRCARGPGATVAVVDPHRCRACKTCKEICELGAPQFVGPEPHRSCWIDPSICAGCGTCAAHCPSGAITAGYSTDAELEAMMAALMAAGERHDETG
ncbi:MAG: FAD-dependent oxidoreductase [Desulfobacterales bacterium]|nr:MAG: FAD-dependent oxidoreductase [Desulfobacterales bacterium]